MSKKKSMERKRKHSQIITSDSVPKKVPLSIIEFIYQIDYSFLMMKEKGKSGNE
jgi:hypothetical protein